MLSEEITNLSVRKAFIKFWASIDISMSEGKLSERWWSMILPYVPTSESA